VLRTHSPLRPSIATRSAFDLHVLSTPPAFILSQDQTLRRELPSTPSRRTGESYRSRRSTTPVVARRKSPLSIRRSGGPLKLTSGVFPITSQLLRCRRHSQTAAPSAGAQSCRRQSGRDNTTLPLACQETEKPMQVVLAPARIGWGRSDTASILANYPKPYLRPSVSVFWFRRPCGGSTSSLDIICCLAIESRLWS
jgi:hypothetical protein